MNDEALAEWDALRTDYAGADVLLGNGFSRRFSQAFDYDSLFNSFLNTLDLHQAAIATSFGTTNFETILEWLDRAHHVNTVLGLAVAEIEGAQALFRTGLASAVHRNHPLFDQIDHTAIDTAVTDLAPYGNIFTLNYDLLLYHIIMHASDRFKRDKSVAPYNDYYWDWDPASRVLQFKNYQHYTHYKHVYYLHGALFLFHADYIDQKIVRQTGRDLLESIGEEIRVGTIPLFVSEGTSFEKRRAISRSDYLRFASNALEARRDRMIIFGASLSGQDAHIAEAIKRGTKKVAYGVYRGHKDDLAIALEIAQIRAVLKGVTVEAFDSAGFFR